MFSLYHSSQKRILSCVLAVSDIAWSMYMWLVSDLMSPAWRHAALIVFPGNYFWCTIMFHWHEGLICEIMFTRWIASNFSCKYHGVANATIVERWSNLGQYFPKKWAKIKIQEQFSVRITSQTSLLINMSHDVSPTCLSVWLFNYPQNLPFFSLKSSLEFTLHCGKYISLSASPPIFWSKFHLCTNNSHDNFLVNCTVVFVFFS